MWVSNLYCQVNLIINGDCEIITNCPDQPNQLSYCEGWFNYSIVNSPDLISTCGLSQFTSIPSNIGYQLPHSGNNYIHFAPTQLSQNFVYNSHYYSLLDTIVEYRESILGSLSESLQNKYYQFECYINYTSFSTSPTNKRLAINAFDLKLLDSIEHPLTCSPLHIDTMNLINLNPSNLILDDTLNWVKLSVCFKANGGEKFFAIGCMRDSSLISYTYSGDINENIQFFSSYFFDSFSLIECDTCCGNIPPVIPIEEGLEIANSASSSIKPIVFTANLSGNSYAKMEIYDSRGRIVEKHIFTTDDNLYTPSINLQKALYHYRFETEKGFYQSGKFIVVE